MPIGEGVRILVDEDEVLKKVDSYQTDDKFDEVFVVGHRGY